MVPYGQEAHAELPTPEEKDPAVQEVHIEAPLVLMYVPVAHEVQVVALLPLYEPALQEVQVDAPLPLYVPAAQVPHTEETEAPLVVLNVPAAQEVHAAVPVVTAL